MPLLLQQYLSKFLLKENGPSFSNRKIRKSPTIIKQKHRNHKIHATKLVLATIIIGIFVSIWFRFTIISFAHLNEYLNYTVGEEGASLFSCALSLHG